ncbi:MAG TPA: hypothetical protein VGF84_12955 [Micromonosporaceae bacterium]
MRALFPGALVGGFLGLILGWIAAKASHASKTVTSAGKIHTAAVKALSTAKATRRGAVGSFALALLVVIGVMFLLGYVSIVGG